MRRTFNVRSLLERVKQEKRIDNLINTLKVLDETQASRLLKTLGPKLSEGSPEMYKRLVNHLRDPVFVFEKLSFQEVQRLWGTLSMNEREVMAGKLPKDTLQEYQLPVPDSFVPGALLDQKEYAEALERFHENFRHLQGQGQIPQFSLLLNSVAPAPCYQLDKMISERVRAVVQDPIISVEDVV